MSRPKQGRTALVFLAPFLLVFLMFRFGPSIAGLLVSLTKWNIIGTPVFVGFDQYVRMFRDETFYTALLNTLYFVALTTPSLIVLSLLLAVLVNKPLKGRNVVRTVIFLPYVLMPAVIGLIWNWLYDTNFGIINYYLHAIGLPTIAWLTSSSWALISISISTVWWLTGYNMILFLAGLQNIPRGLYESAQIDGAGPIRSFWSITIPLLAPVLSVVISLTMINVIKLFDQIFVMTGGGPGVSTLTLVQYMYTQAFQSFNLGYGAALSLVILVLLVVLVFIQARIVKSMVGEA